MRKKTRLIVLVALLLGATGSGWIVVKRRSARADAKKTYAVKRQAIAHTLQIAGKVMAKESIVITAHQSGRIVDIPVDEGDHVETGDVLFAMRLEADGQEDLSQKRADVRSLEQQVAAATAQLKEKKPVQELIGSAAVLKEETDLEKLKLDLTAARERLAVLENDLGLSEETEAKPSAAGKGRKAAKTAASGKRKATSRDDDDDGVVYVTAPSDGIVTLIDKRIGDYVQGGAGLSTATDTDRMVMIVADMESVLIRTRVLEADLRYVRPGIPVKVRFDAYPGTSYAGKVEHIGGQGRTDAKAGYTYFDVDVSLERQDDRLLPEMNATVELIFDKKENVLTLPVASVIIFPDKAIVHVPDPEQPTGFRDQQVEVGVVNESDVEIVAGLKDGDQVMEVDFAALKLDGGDGAPDGESKPRPKSKRI